LPDSSAKLLKGDSGCGLGFGLGYMIIIIRQSLCTVQV